jgi:RNA polymerase primary sigma factor
MWVGVSFMRFKDDVLLRQYFSEIDPGPLLTREQEYSLSKEIEKAQNEMLEMCLTSRYGLSELAAHLRYLDTRRRDEDDNDNIESYSKKLDEDSSAELIEQTRQSFIALVAELNGKADIETVKRLSDEVNLSGVIVSGVFQKLKIKYNLLSDYQSKLKTYEKLFDTESMERIEMLCKEVNANPSIRLEVESRTGMGGKRLLLLCRDFGGVRDGLAKLEKDLPEGVTLRDINDLYVGMSQSEFKMKIHKDEFIKKNLRLVINRAKQYQGHGLDLGDLIQEGSLGLIKAVDKFDSSRKTKVATYATWWIDQSIRRAISNKGRPVRIPTHVEELHTQVRKATHELQGNLKRKPFDYEVAEKIGKPVAQLRELQTRAQYPMFLDDVMLSGNTLNEILPSESAENPEEAVERKLRQEKIREILGTLSARTQKIIRMRFGIGELEGAEGMTLEEIAQEMGVTKQAIRIHVDRATQRMQRAARKLYDVE